MKEITQKFRVRAAEKFIPFAEMLRRGGVDDSKIIAVLHKYLEQKRRQFINETNGFQQIGKVIKCSLKQDSKIEGRFYFLLDQLGIPFAFQYKIGPYRADFVVDGFLVVEIDGPQHNGTKDYDEKRDQFIRNMGYKVLRIPVWLLEIEYKAVLNEIVEIVNEHKKKSKINDGQKEVANEKQAIEIF